MDKTSVTFVINKEGPAAFKQRLTELLRFAGIGHLQIVVDEGLDREASAADPAVAAAFTAIGKSAMIWEATLRSVERQVGELKDGLSASCDGHKFGAELERVFYSKVQPMLETLDASLLDKLDEVAGESDPDARRRVVAEARPIIRSCDIYIADNTG